MTNICIAGAAGRMGRMIAALAEAEGFSVTGALEAPGLSCLGESYYGTAITDDLGKALEGARCVIDFALAKGIEKRVEAYAAQGIPAVIGTTGVDEEGLAAINKASEKIPVIHAANFSLGVNLLGALLEKAAAVLDESYDCEIVEMHHNKKKDAPSGTAIFLAGKVEEGRKAGREKEIFGRSGLTGERPKGEIAIHALRGGDVVGDHTVIFAAEGERVEFSHKAGSRANFAKGALRAARFLVGKKAGIYTMSDVIGLK